MLNGKVQLGRRRLFRILPTQYPVCDWHPALYGLLGNGDHLVFLRGSSRCEEVQCAVMGELFPPKLVLGSEDVIHKFRNHDRLGLAEVRALHLFGDHSRLNLSMAS